MKRSTFRLPISDKRSRRKMLTPSTSTGGLTLLNRNNDYLAEENLTTV